ncbi:MAG: M1 family metallopeptidase [Bacteroidota bacterium]|nr:M1 family metallopeptidase [Bacteroidota bacterium]
MMRKTTATGFLLWLALCPLLLVAQLGQSTEPERIVTRFELPSTERERLVDFEHIRIAVRFDPPAKRVIGQVTHVFTPLRDRVDSIVLDGIGMMVQRVYRGDTMYRFRTTDSTVVIYGTWRYPSRDSFTIDYECSPKRGMYFPGWDDPTGRKRKQIWTQGQPFDTRHWVPIYDYPNDKAITETIITFDSAYTVLSNGTLREKRQNPDGTVTWHYSMTKPHATYLIMIAIGKYGVLERRSRSGVPLRLYYYADKPEWAEPTYRYSAEMVDFLEQRLGVPFPWESYAQVPVQDYIAGAMENTTATVFGDFFHGDERAALDRSYVGVNMHELTHQWFGDFVTQRDERSIWLHESFATFYPKLFYRHLFGEDYHHWMRRSEQRAALTAAQNNQLPILHRNAGTARIYSKGSAVLDMLVDVVGEEQFHRAVRHYLRAHAYGRVETRDFERAFADTLGMNLHWFFDQWLYRGGEPTYRVRTTPVADPRTGEQWIEFTVEQTQTSDALQPLFRMPINFEVYYQDGSRQTVRQWISDRFHIVRVPNPKKQPMLFALFDPGAVILKRVEFEKSTPELMAQARLAQFAIDRYDAIEALIQDSTLSDSVKAHFLGERFAAERFFAVRALIVRTLAGDERLHRFAIARRTLSQALHDNDVEVRRAVVTALRTVPGWLRTDVERCLQDSSYQIVGRAVELLAESFPSAALEYVERVRDCEGAHYRVRIACERIRAERGDTAALARLVDYASPSYEFITRENAIAALRALNWCDTLLVRYLLDARFHFNSRLVNAAREAIAQFARNSRYRELFQRSVATLPEQWQREQLLQHLR